MLMVAKGFVLGLTFSMFLMGCVSKGTHESSLKKIEELEAKAKDEGAAIERLGLEKTDLLQKLQENEEKLILAAKDKGQLKSSLDDMKQALEEMRQRQAEQKRQLEDFQDLTKRFSRLTDSGTLSVKMLDGKMVVSLGSDILFSSGSAKLSSQGLDAIREVTQQLALIQGKKYQVEGHTDTVPISTAVFPSNWELASARALTVVKFMVEQGMTPERISAASYGQYQPISVNDTAEGKASNRRIAIVIVPDLSSLKP